MKRIAALLLVLLVTIAGAYAEIPYTFADREAGVETLMSNETYYAGFSQNDLDFKLQKAGATMEEYLPFARQQVLDFTDEEKALIDAGMAKLEDILLENGYRLPALEPIVFINTTMAEEAYPAAYTHGTQIYIGDYVMKMMLAVADGTDQGFLTLLAHELFHCLTRSNPDFRRDMYSLIHFTVQDGEYEIPDSAREYFISNPDVEHHDAWATFRIDGRDVDCFAAFVTTKHFEKAGELFFDSGITALIPVEGDGTWYTSEDAENFDEVFGRNTDYVIDPEECMADNFSYALVYDLEGKDYPNPEIVQGILDYLAGN